MPGKVTAVEVATGEKIAKGQRLLTLEAMKMEHALTAPFDGTVAELSRHPRRAGHRRPAAGEDRGQPNERRACLAVASARAADLLFRRGVRDRHHPADHRGPRAATFVPRSDHDHLVALAHLTPSFVAFFISFFVIGAFWAGHHRAFSLSRHWSPHAAVPQRPVIVRDRLHALRHRLHGLTWASACRPMLTTQC